MGETEVLKRNKISTIDYKNYFPRSIKEIFKLRIDHHIQPNTLEYLAEYIVIKMACLYDEGQGQQSYVSFCDTKLYMMTVLKGIIIN